MSAYIRDRSLSVPAEPMAGKRGRKRRRRKRQRRLSRRMRKVGGTAAVREKGDALLEQAALVDAGTLETNPNNTARFVGAVAVAGGLLWAVSQ